MTTLRAIRSTQEVDITIGMFHGKDITLRRTPLATTLREIKLKIENISGIPVHCQRITYLDECDMYDNRNLEWYDVVEKARLNLKVSIKYPAFQATLLHWLYSGKVKSRTLIC